MNLEDRINAFCELGHRVKHVSGSLLETIEKKAAAKNPWFTPESVRLALGGICHYLKEENLGRWLKDYDLDQVQSKTIGVAMAGNIPLVGFHDYLCVLIAGHRSQIKLSSQDEELLPWLHEILTAIEPRFESRVTFVDRLQLYDAAIATGSDNTARYFSYYFKHVPHIIRKNRSSCAVLIGGETREELEELGLDVFRYFGLGCRNVSKLYIPTEYDLIPVLQAWEKFGDIVNHNKYGNNYHYQRSIHLMNQKHFYDNGGVILVEEEKLVSPIAVVYYERYSDQPNLKLRIDGTRDKLQCIASAKAWYQGSIEFGKSQIPDVWDYSDNVDTLRFLTAL